MENRDAVYLIVVYALASAIWLPNIESIPVWFWDEGVNLDYADNLAEGRLEWFSLKYAFVPHPPFYIMALSAVTSIFGDTILAGRLFSVSMNYAIIFLLYLFGCEIADKRTGFYASLAYSVYPAAVYWGRMTFSNTLLSLLILASLYCFIRYLKSPTRWWIGTVLFAGLASVTQPQGLFLVSALCAYFIFGEKSGVKPLVLLFSPPIFFFVFMSLNSEYFIEDVIYHLRLYNLLNPKILFILPVLAILSVKWRYFNGFLGNLLSREVNTLFESRDLFRQKYVPATLLAAHFISSKTLIDPLSDKALFVGGDYYWLGIVGLLFISSSYMKHVVLVFFMPVFLSVLAFGRADHMLIPLYPFFCIGLVTLLKTLFDQIRGRAGVLAAFILLSYPFLFSYVNSLDAFLFGNVLGEEALSDVREVSEYVNSVSDGNDLVLTTSNLVRFFPRSSILTQSVVYHGYPVDYYRGDYPKSRFTGNISYLNAGYVVVKDGMLGSLKPYAPDVVSEVSAWKLVNRSGSYAVYRNPTGV